MYYIHDSECNYGSSYETFANYLGQGYWKQMSEDIARMAASNVCVGDIVYWVSKNSGCPFIDVGIVIDIFSDCYKVARLCRNKYIKIKIYNEKSLVIKTQEELDSWVLKASVRKYKNGDYENPIRVIDLAPDGVSLEVYSGTYTISNKDEIKNQYNSGMLEQASKIPLLNCKLECNEVTPGSWRPCLRWKENRITVEVDLDKKFTFDSYENAKTLLDNIVEERKYVSGLSDEEFSLYEIGYHLNTLSKMGRLTIEECEKIYAYMKDKRNLGNIESKVGIGTLQWRYYDESNWKSVRIENLI